MNERIQNLTIDQPRVRAGDVRVEADTFDELCKTQLTGAHITGRLLRVLNNEGKEEAVFDGGFVACKENADSTPRSAENLEIKKESIAQALCTKIIDTLLEISPAQLANRNNDDRNPLITFSAQDLRDMNFGLYDKYLEGWMSYEQARKGKVRMEFMEDVFKKTDEHFQQDVRGKNLRLSLRLSPENGNLTIYLRNMFKGMLAP